MKLYAASMHRRRFHIVAETVHVAVPIEAEAEAEAEGIANDVVRIMYPPSEGWFGHSAGVRSFEESMRSADVARVDRGANRPP